MQKEAALQRQVDEFLKRAKDMGVPVWWMKVHGEVRQKGGVPDYIMCIDGKFVAMELKSKKGLPTDRQLLTMRAMKKAGAVTEIVRSLDELKRVLNDNL